MLNFMTRELTVYHEGKEATDEQVYSHLWNYSQALIAAEDQIKDLIQLIKNGDSGDIAIYKENHHPQENQKEVYRLDHFKWRMFVAMAKNDSKNVSYWLNRYNLLNEKLNSIKETEGGASVVG